MYYDDADILGVMYVGADEFTSGFFTFSSIPEDMNVEELKTFFNNTNCVACPTNYLSRYLEFMGFDLEIVPGANDGIHMDFPNEEIFDETFDDGYHLNLLYEETQIDEELSVEISTDNSLHFQLEEENNGHSSVIEDNTESSPIVEDNTESSSDSEYTIESSSIFEDTNVDLSSFNESNIGEVFQDMCSMVEAFL